MKLRRFVVLSVVLVALIFGVQAQGQKWLHVRVESASPDGERVKLNIPFALIEVVLPKIEAEELSGGKVKFAGEELSIADLREIWAEVKQSGNSELVTVTSKDTNVRVSMEGDSLIIRTTDNSKENVSVTVPTVVMDALLQGNGEELDVLAAVKALSEHNLKDLVSVEADDQKVRVWIDESSTGE